MSADFHTTRWSLVVEAAADHGEQSRRALAELCAAYWYPVYAFARRGGSDADDARDLTQGFFTELIEKSVLGDADRERGRFRTFLIAAFRHHCSKQRERARAAKRGGGVPAMSLDIDVAAGEERFARAAGRAHTPETLFEQQWALTLLARAVDAVAGEYRESGRERVFEALRPALAGEKLPPYDRLAASLDMSEGAVKTAVHRLRRRYREHLRQEIAETVSDPAEIDDEIRYLIGVVSR